MAKYGIHNNDINLRLMFIFLSTSIIYALNIKSALYLRILEIISKLLCKCVFLLIPTMLLYNNGKIVTVIIINSLIAVIVIVWPIVVIYVPTPCTKLLSIHTLMCLTVADSL